MTFTPTAEQEAIVLAARERSESIMVYAYAGCAKTTTLELLSKALPKGPALALAFNVKIKKELEKRFPSNIDVLTLNGLGHRAWSNAIGRGLVVEDNKIGNLVKKLCDKNKSFWPEWANIRQLVTLAMQAGLVPDEFSGRKGLVEDSEENWIQIARDAYLDLGSDAIWAARTVLINSIMMGHGREGPPTICFDDQLYLSTMFGGHFPRYPLVLVDEAQDLSPLNHLQVKKAAAGRLIVVGDPKQAIYAFRGADSASMEKLRSLRPEWIDLPLATTFRCPKAIVSRQQSHAPGFTAAETNLPGSFLGLVYELFLKAGKTHQEFEKDEAHWAWKDVEAYRQPGKTLAVLCRNNAPLLSLALRLISQRVGVTVLGKDIGKGLIALAKKILKDDKLPAKDCYPLIDAWAEKEMAYAQANGQESKLDGISDRAQCLTAVLGSCNTAGELRSTIEDLFSRQDGQVILATGHKAKGLEWDVVVHLDPFRLPSKWARKRGGSALEQEKNLKYVIETRTKDVLLEADLESFGEQE